MIKLQRLGHILINVRDIERSKAFYTGILGFHVLEQDPDHGGLFLSLGEYGNTLDIFQSTNPDEFPQPQSQLGNREGAAWQAEEIRVIEPNFSANRWLATYPMTDTRQKERLAQALLPLGL